MRYISGSLEMGLVYGSVHESKKQYLAMSMLILLGELTQKGLYLVIYSQFMVEL